MQRALQSRGFISAILAMATGMFLFYTHPFPEEQVFLRVIAMRAPQAFLSFKYLYYTLLFTTPYLACSTVGPSRQDAFPSIPIPAREATSFLSSAKYITPANRCLPKLPFG